MTSVKSKIHGVKVDKVVDPSAHFDFPLLNDLHYTNRLVEKYLGKKDFLTKYLGKGTHGYAYLTKDGTVYKFTQNNSEASSSLILFMFGNKLETQGGIYKIYEIKIGTQRLFIIEKEYIQPLREYLEKKLNVENVDSRKISSMLGELLDSEHHETFGEFKKHVLEWIEDVDTKYTNVINELFTNEKLMKSIFNFHKNVIKNSEEAGMPLEDTHIGNIGIKNNQVICFDCATQSQHILKQGGMIKKQIKDSTIKSKISQPKIGKLGWDKVSPVIWKTVIRDNRHAYINNQGVNYDLFIYDYNKSKNEPIDGGSFESFDAAEDWLINNYAREELKEIFKTEEELKQFFISEGYKFTHYENERTHEEDGKLYYNPDDLAEQYGFKKHFADGGKGRFDGWIYKKGTNDWIDYMILKNKFSDGGTTKDKRYAVTTDMYDYAKDDESVIKQAQEFVGDLRNRLDNQAQIVDITEAPFGSMKTRKLENVPKYKDGGKSRSTKDDFENLPEIDLGIDISTDWIKLWEKFKRENNLDVELPHKDPKDRDEQSDNAYFMLRHIVKIRRGPWTPDWNNTSQKKYYPWFRMKTGKTGFVFHDSYYAYDGSLVGSRMCFPSAELCEATAKEFLAIYRIYFTEN